ARLHLFKNAADGRRDSFAEKTVQSVDDPSLPPVQQSKPVREGRLPHHLLREVSLLLRDGPAQRPDRADEPGARPGLVVSDLLEELLHLGAAGFRKQAGKRVHPGPLCLEELVQPINRRQAYLLLSGWLQHTTAVLAEEADGPLAAATGLPMSCVCGITRRTSQHSRPRWPQRREAGRGRI